MMSSSESVADFGDETPTPRGIVLLPDLPSFDESLRFFVATSMPAGLIEVWLAKRRRRVELNRFLTWLSVLSMIGRWGWIKVSRFYSGSVLARACVWRPVLKSAQR